MQPIDFPEGDRLSILTARVVPVLRRAAAILLWTAGFALGAFPVALVMLERWWRMPGIRDMARDHWCRLELLCKTPLPSYFIWIFPAWLLFTGLAIRATRRSPFGAPAAPVERASRPAVSARQRLVADGAGLAAGLIALASAVIGIANGRIPGAEIALAAGGLLLQRWLLERPWAGLRLRLAAGLKRALPLAFGWLVLVLFLRDLSTPGSPAGLSGLCLALTAWALIRRGDTPPVYWIGSLSLALLAYHIGDWRYSVVGDEFSFFHSASNLLAVRPVWAHLNRLFNGLWVYHSHPYLSSLIQAATMKLLGVNNFGWRFSNLFLIAASLFFFYRFFTRFLSRRVALLTVFLMGCSHYLMNFGKIGYNNPQALFLLAAMLWAGGEAVLARSRFSYAVLGATMGLAFYLYPAALYALPLPVLLALLYDPPRSRPAWRRYLSAALPFCLLYLPILFQPDYWAEKLPGTFLNPENPAGPGNLALHLVSNFVYALYSYLYTISESHFVVSSYVDPVTALLLPLGLGRLLGRLKQERFGRFWVIGFVFMLLAVGATHDRAEPATTRMFLLLPWFCSFGALGLDWLAGQLHGRAARVVTALVLAAVVATNLYMAFPLTRQRYAGVGGVETYFVRLLQRDRQLYGDSDKTYLFITQTGWNIDGFYTLRDLYGLPQSRAQLVRVALEEPTLPLDMLLLAKSENTLIILQPWMDSPLRESVAARLDGLGKARCVVQDTLQSEPLFTYWYSGRWQALCPLDADWSIP